MPSSMSAGGCCVPSRMRENTVGAQLGEITERLLERRPVLLLLGVEPQPGLHARDPRVGEGAEIIRRRAKAARADASDLIASEPGPSGPPNRCA